VRVASDPEAEWPWSMRGGTKQQKERQLNGERALHRRSAPQGALYPAAPGGLPRRARASTRAARAGPRTAGSALEPRTLEVEAGGPRGWSFLGLLGFQRAQKPRGPFPSRKFWSTATPESRRSPGGWNTDYSTSLTSGSFRKKYPSGHEISVTSTIVYSQPPTMTPCGSSVKLTLK